MNTTTTRKPERILVEDDEEAFHEIVASMLTSAGYECRIAETPMETLDVLNSAEDFDLVCSGITEWPEQDFTRMVETFPDIPVVASSGVLDITFMLKVLHMGAYDFLLRPFDRDQLIFAVRRALEYRRLKLENLYLRDKIAKTQSRAFAVVTLLSSDLSLSPTSLAGQPPSSSALLLTLFAWVSPLLLERSV